MDDNKFEISREISIDAGHRVPFHESKCYNVHGHRYRIEAHCKGDLHQQGAEKDMVMDFSFLKEEMMNVIDQDCDHGLILWSEDPLLEPLAQADSFNVPLSSLQHEVKDKGYVLTTWSGGKLYLIDAIPTAESLAKHWFVRLAEPIQQRSNGLAQLLKICVWETPHCKAEFPSSNNHSGA